MSNSGGYHSFQNNMLILVMHLLGILVTLLHSPLLCTTGFCVCLQQNIADLRTVLQDRVGGLVFLATSLSQETCLAQVQVDTLQTAIPAKTSIVSTGMYT